MDAWTLPTTLNVGGIDYAIRTDYRVILDILTAMNDPEIFESWMSEKEKQWERCLTVLKILYVDFEQLPVADYQEACQKACEFIDCGLKDDGKERPRTMDWMQDAPVIIPAVNKIYRKDVRAVEYMHWWTFFGLYMEIGESLYSQILNIRQKRSRGKKLEKWEEEFYRNNKVLVDLKVKKPERSDEEKDALRKLFGFKK